MLITGNLKQAEAQVTVSGKVIGFVYNRIGDYDGLRVQTEQGTATLAFPPHTAARVRELAAAGQRITAGTESGPHHPGPPAPMPGGEGPETAGTFRLKSLRNDASGKQLSLRDIPPPLPKAGQLIQSEGELISKIVDGQGQLAALLTKKYLIELKPHQAQQISSMLPGVQRIGFTGFERSAEGFVNRTGRPVIHPTTLTIHGQTFAL